MAKKQASLLQVGVPFMLFMLGGWYALAHLVDSKRQLQVRSGVCGVPDSRCAVPEHQGRPQPPSSGPLTELNST